MDELMSIYIEDTKEYLALLYDSLMLLEKKSDDSEAVNEIFRAFHTMKSSTAAMEYRETAHFIHCMEDLLQEIRDGKIKIDFRVIKLLWDSHDLLEIFLQNVMQDGNEGNVDYSGITEIVRKIVNGEYLCSGPESGAENRETGNDKNDNFPIDKDDLSIIREMIKKGCIVYKITVSLVKDCMFKAVRTWMVLEEIAKHSKIVWSLPAKPTIDDFHNEGFDINDTVIYAIIVCDMPAEQLISELESALSEIESIRIAPVKPDLVPGLYEKQPEPAADKGNASLADGGTGSISEIIDSIINGNDDGISIRPHDVFSPEFEKIGEILVQSGHIWEEEINEIIEKQEKTYPDLKFGQIAVKENKVEPKDVIEALQSQEKARLEFKNQAYIRIPAFKIDNLVDLLGELLIVQSLHKQEISGLFSSSNKIINNIIRMERITKDIQDISMSMRMVSLKQTFQKICRIGRDTAAELGKNVDIDVSGEDTEIDRSVVEKIHDPLMHLIRNAISHGIEGQNERVEAGKPAQGNVRIVAYNRRGNVYIEIHDDGKGLSKEKIYGKALEKGLIDPSARYGDDDIYKFIFLPGFSTEEHINNISGRGVGMNVVQTEITKLGGKVDIINRPGAGCTFILRIPVNLATINGTIVDIWGTNYVIPTLCIKQILKPEKDQWISIKGKRTTVKVRDEIIQVIPLREILQYNISDESLDSSIITVIEHEQKLMALPVKTIQGKQEVVVKPIGDDFRHLNFISGATILGDGKVSIILDVEALFRMSEETRI